MGLSLTNLSLVFVAKISFFNITLSKVLPMIAISMLSMVIWTKKVDKIKIIMHNAESGLSE